MSSLSIKFHGPRRARAPGADDAGAAGEGPAPAREPRGARRGERRAGLARRVCRAGRGARGRGGDRRAGGPVAWVQMSELKYFNFDFDLEEDRNIKII